MGMRHLICLKAKRNEIFFKTIVNIVFRTTEKIFLLNLPLRVIALQKAVNSILYKTLNNSSVIQKFFRIVLAFIFSFIIQHVYYILVISTHDEILLASRQLIQSVNYQHTDQSCLQFLISFPNLQLMLQSGLQFFL